MDRKILIKLSGDLYGNPLAEEEIEKASQAAETHVICGFGTEYSNLLKESRISFHYEQGKRVIDDPAQEHPALLIGYGLQKKMQDGAMRRHPMLRGFISCISSGFDGKLENTNGDELVTRHASEFSEVLVYTLRGRKESSPLKAIPNVRIVYF